MNPSKKNGRRGRKPLLDESKRREICAIIACGGTRTQAARYVGYSLDTVARAADRDPAFATQILRAEFSKRDLCPPPTTHLTATLAKLPSSRLWDEK